MRIKKYSSDLSPKSWQVIEKIIQVRRKSKWDLQEIVNAIFYLTKNGCVWRDIPGEFPPWITVYWYFCKWGKIKRTYKNRCGSRRVFIFNNYDDYLILSQFVCLK